MTVFYNIFYSLQRRLKRIEFEKCHRTQRHKRLMRQINPSSVEALRNKQTIVHTKRDVN